MLEEAMKKLEFNPEDDTKTTILKGIGVGVIEGLAIVGATHVIANIFKSNKK